MPTARDWEWGHRPKCAACGRELDPETDTRHDGYRGSPHAHGGRGSYGLGAHHYVFHSLCEWCEETRRAPLREILQYDHSWEWLACGHKHRTPRNLWGAIRPGNRRRCDKCRTCAPAEFAAETVRACAVQKSAAYKARLEHAVVRASQSLFATACGE